ncbi:hypothetical protein IFM89_008391 [Coptis chinensis]|uniref:DUF674 family protein n=1 Tax=Coptis chinensis TaxID=261450 RepID=A0A835HDA4_9MAGN|nr:hypothetical protein IFM89_008391 [Coptis chinensis]
MGATESKVINLRILVDTKRERVVFAEADNDLVDILFSFLTLPVGTIVRLIRTQSSPLELGCMNNLYKSLENLEVGLFQSDRHKAMLLRPSNSSQHLCTKLKFNIDAGTYENVDSKVLPLSTSTSVELLTKLGVKDASVLEERIVKVGKVEVLSLLRLSLLSMKPLTDLFLLKNVDCSGASTSDPTCQFQSRDSINKLRRSKMPTLSGGKMTTLKIMLRKSDGKVLSAEAQEDFIDYLLSLLAIPLGTIVNYLERTPSLGCISNLYSSIQELSVDRHLKAEFMTNLLSPKLASEFGYKSQLLSIYESFLPNNKCLLRRSVRAGKVDISRNLSINAVPIGVNGFINGPATFVVTDDLNALRLLEASLTSKSALNGAFNLHLSKIKIEE